MQAPRRTFGCPASAGGGKKPGCVMPRRVTKKTKEYGWVVRGEADGEQREASTRSSKRKGVESNVVSVGVAG
jgi:hypothetical protein